MPSPAMVEYGETEAGDILATHTGGGKAIRGGVIRITGYGSGSAVARFGLLLTRGVRDFGAT
jgi:hypothetical protein